MAVADTQTPSFSLMKIFALSSLFAAPLLAAPLAAIEGLVNITERAPSFEWTAWGDSYASGVGAGNYINGRRCLRYDGAYGPLIQADPENQIPGEGGKLNNVVCSGAKAQEIIDYQFYDSDQTWGQPNWEYYPRPGSGKPVMGTLTVGGDDIDFPGILNNCIVEGFPYPLSSGFTKRTCDEQRALSWSKICQDGNHDEPNNDLVASIDSVIKKAVEYGRGASGDGFKLYVTSYAQFFNDEDPGCDTVTFARKANPNPDNQPHVMLTTDIRKDFNAMSRTLNAAINKAVGQNSDSGVHFVDIDGLMGTGHRFCEPGVQEPDQNNGNLWFFHYPYNQNDQGDTSDDPTINYLNSVAETSLTTMNYDPQGTLWTDVLNDFWDNVDETQFAQSHGDDPNTQANVWPDVIGYRAKVFHPQPGFHSAIYKQILKQYNDDLNAESAPPSDPQPPPPAYATGTCCFHLREVEDCGDWSDNLWGGINLVDNDKNTIFDNRGDNSGLGMKINDGNGASFQGPLPNRVEVTGEHQNDYVQFTYGDLSWTSKEANGGGQCSNGGWDPRSGPICAGIFGEVFATNDMDCCFPC